MLSMLFSCRSLRCCSRLRTVLSAAAAVDSRWVWSTFMSLMSICTAGCNIWALIFLTWRSWIVWRMLLFAVVVNQSRCNIKLLTFWSINIWTVTPKSDWNAHWSLRTVVEYWGKNHSRSFKPSLICPVTFEHLTMAIIKQLEFKSSITSWLFHFKYVGVM